MAACLPRYTSRTATPFARREPYNSLHQMAHTSASASRHASSASVSYSAELGIHLGHFRRLCDTARRSVSLLMFRLGFRLRCRSAPAGLLRQRGTARLHQAADGDAWPIFRSRRDLLQRLAERLHLLA